MVINTKQTLKIILLARPCQQTGRHRRYTNWTGDCNPDPLSQTVILSRQSPRRIHSKSNPFEAYHTPTSNKEPHSWVQRFRIGQFFQWFGHRPQGRPELVQVISGQ